MSEEMLEYMVDRMSKEMSDRMLVGDFKHFLIFHNIWDVILPIGLFFQRGRSTTNQNVIVQSTGSRPSF